MSVVQDNCSLSLSPPPSLYSGDTQHSLACVPHARQHCAPEHPPMSSTIAARHRRRWLDFNRDPAETRSQFDRSQSPTGSRSEFSQIVAILRSESNGIVVAITLDSARNRTGFHP